MVWVLMAQVDQVLHVSGADRDWSRRPRPEREGAQLESVKNFQKEKVYCACTKFKSEK